MIDSKYSPELSQLCGETATLLMFLGHNELAIKFALCLNDSDFIHLCHRLEEWNGDNPIGDGLLDKVREIREIHKIVEMLDNQEDI